MSIKFDPGGFPQRRAGDIPAVTAVQMREIQRLALEECGCDILMIMENAGRAIATIALAMLGGRGRNQRIVVLCGGGNVGGAGLAAVRHLGNWGMNAAPLLAGMETEMAFGARRQLAILRQAGVGEALRDEISEFAIEEEMAHADLVVDAIVGYGLEGPPSGIAAAVTELAVAARRPILAVDVPTGVSATTGEAFTPHIHAGTTLMLDLPKRGLLDPQARPWAGTLYLADVGTPRGVHEQGGMHVGDTFSEGPIVRIRR